MQEPCTVMLFKTSKDEALLRRVRGEYREMPGLRLTIDQAMRLWGIDRQTCSELLASLVAAGFLETGRDGRYRKAHSGY
jgi:DNA-binding IclR family transcriptional regulator